MPEHPSDRISHEDTLLASRVAAYLTANAFVTIAFVTVSYGSLSTTTGGVILELAIVGLGVFLAFFFTAIGRRSVTAIRFYRACAREGISDVPDSSLREFFRDGRTKLDNGITLGHVPSHQVTKTETKSIGKSIPWIWRGASSPNDVIGVLLPGCLAFFWVAVSFTISWGSTFDLDKHVLPSWPFIGLSVLVVVLFLFLWMVSTWPLADVGRETKSDGGSLMAVLGRGIQYRVGKWLPSPDREICRRLSDGIPLHSAIPIPGDLDGPDAIVGGGQLNVEAAAALLRQQRMSCVLGFAGPAPYLWHWNGGDDGPSESGPMEAALRMLVPDAEVLPWTPRGEFDPGPHSPSDTRVEVGNVMRLAEERGYSRVRFITITPHVARVAFWAQRLRRVDFTVESSESILVALSPAHAQRVYDLQSSSAYRTTVHDERAGLEKLLLPISYPSA